MKREGNYDLLRIISAVAVVMIHVSSIWFDGAIESISKSGLSVTDIQSPYWICIYGSLSRFAVPCFVHLYWKMKKILNIKDFIQNPLRKLASRQLSSV